MRGHRRHRRAGVAVVGVALALGCGSAGDTASVPAVIDLWADGVPAFGVFVPNERSREESVAARERGERLTPLYTREGAAAFGANPLYDFAFLNLEGTYDPEAVRVVAEGLREGPNGGGTALLVRIPPISEAGSDTTRARVREILAFGADGIVFPHVRNPDEARLAAMMMADAGADVWSPSNPGGTALAMIMIEDPDALAAAAEIADTPGISILACGIGSLTRALGGDRAAAEAGTQRVLAESQRVGVPNMLTANTETVEQRVREGFLALLTQGSTADEVIGIGRTAAGRDAVGAVASGH